MMTIRGTAAVLHSFARPAFRSCAFVLLFGGASPATAQMTWDATRQGAGFADGSDRSVVLFRGHSAAGKPVAIRSATPTCDCANATIENATSAPDRPAVVRVVLTKSANHPDPSTSVKVTTSDGAEHLLHVDREAVRHVKVTPAFVWWKVNALAEEKEFLIQADPDTRPLAELKLAPSSENFTVAKERLDPHRWRLRVRPRSTTQPEAATILCQIRHHPGDSSEAPRKISAHLKIAQVP